MTAANLCESLESKCAMCNGEGSRLGEDGWCRCHACNGAGYVPTELGRSVLSLMRHNLKPMLEDLKEKQAY